jgi:hypothetical protein
MTNIVPEPTFEHSRRRDASHPGLRPQENHFRRGQCTLAAGMRCSEYQIFPGIHVLRMAMLQQHGHAGRSYA